MSLAARLDALVATIGGHLKSLYGRSVPAGGTAGQTLVKTSNSDFAVGWSDPPGGTVNAGAQWASSMRYYGIY